VALDDLWRVRVGEISENFPAGTHFSTLLGLTQPCFQLDARLYAALTARMKVWGIKKTPLLEALGGHYNSFDIACAYLQRDPEDTREPDQSIRQLIYDVCDVLALALEYRTTPPRFLKMAADGRIARSGEASADAGDTGEEDVSLLKNQLPRRIFRCGGQWHAAAYQRLGSILVEARRALGLHDTDMARLWGIGTATVKAIEAGDVTVHNRHALEALVEHLNIDIDPFEGISEIHVSEELTGPQLAILLRERFMAIPLSYGRLAQLAAIDDEDRDRIWNGSCAVTQQIARNLARARSPKRPVADDAERACGNRKPRRRRGPRQSALFRHHDRSRLPGRHKV
jgi:hypothetical protein